MVETIKFSEMNPGGDLAPGDETPGLLTGANVLFENPWTFLAPGTTAERPSPSAIMVNRLRYNTTLLAYEYYDGTEWVQIAETDGVLTATGTENQVLVNGTFGIPQDGAILLTLPQDIATGSSPTFQSLILSSATSFSLLAGGINATSALQSLTPGTAGQLLQSNGAAAIPSWTTATFPSGSGTLNHLLRSDGTNWVQTTATTLTSADVLSGLTQLNVDNLRLDGNTFSSTNANGIITYSPNGSGYNAFTKDITLETAANPSITIYSDDLLGSSYLTLVDFDLNNSSIIKHSSSGAAILTVSVNPADNISDARMKMFRSTNTSSLESGLEIFKGDGTSTQQTYFRLNSDSFLNAVAGGVMIGSINAPTSKLDVRSDSSGVTVSSLSLVNSIASGIDSGVSLNFQPNAASTRAASIRSIQTTAGNYADLEFYTTGAATPVLSMSINASNKVIVSSTTTAVGSAQFQTIAQGTGAANLIASFVNNTVGSGLRFLKSRSDISGVSAIVQNGDDLARVSFLGDDGTSATTFPEGARIQASISGAVSAGIIPSQLLFYTTNTSGSLINAMTISNDQIISLTNPLPSGSGGTGVNNGASTITLGGSLTTSGAFASTFTMTAATSVTFPTSGTLATTTQVIARAAIAGTSQSAAVNTIYVASSASQTTLSLPSTYAVGDIIGLVGSTANTAGWIIATASGDTIRLNNTTGASSGTLTSGALAGQCVELMCDVANTSWVVMNGTYTTLTLS